MISLSFFLGLWSVASSSGIEKIVASSGIERATDVLSS
jgi:hypothetical protein